VHQSRH